MRSRRPEVTVSVVFCPVANGRPQPELPALAAAGDAATSSPALTASALAHAVKRAARAGALDIDTKILPWSQWLRAEPPSRARSLDSATSISPGSLVVKWSALIAIPPDLPLADHTAT